MVLLSVANHWNAIAVETASCWLREGACHQDHTGPYKPEAGTCQGGDGAWRLQEALAGACGTALGYTSGVEDAAAIAKLAIAASSTLSAHHPVQCSFADLTCLCPTCLLQLQPLTFAKHHHPGNGAASDDWQPQVPFLALAAPSAGVACCHLR